MTAFNEKCPEIAVIQLSLQKLRVGELYDQKRVATFKDPSNITNSWMSNLSLFIN